jgi:hypothetical protein
MIPPFATNPFKRLFEISPYWTKNFFTTKTYNMPGGWKALKPEGLGIRIIQLFKLPGLPAFKPIFIFRAFVINFSS